MLIWLQAVKDQHLFDKINDIEVIFGLFPVENHCIQQKAVYRKWNAKGENKTMTWRLSY